MSSRYRKSGVFAEAAVAVGARTPIGTRRRIWRAVSATATAVVIGLGFVSVTQAQEQGISIPMRTMGSNTYYVNGQIGGLGDINMLVDTGSSYSTISRADLEILQTQERAHFVRELTGVMADGRELHVPIYRISSINIGQNCWLQDVEAAVFPQQVRNILGLSALLKAAPFTFSLDPPALILSNCLGAPTLPLAIVPAENDEPVADTTPAVSVAES